MEVDAYRCPACGYPGLDEPPWEGESASYEICPSCGTQFGYDDEAGGDEGKRSAVYAALREKCEREGMKWWSRSQPPPADWKPRQQREQSGQEGQNAV